MDFLKIRIFTVKMEIFLTIRILILKKIFFIRLEIYIYIFIFFQNVLKMFSSVPR